MMISRGWLSIVAVALLAGACDERPQASKAVQQAASQGNQDPQRPTTQQLLTGPRTRLTLGAIPFSVRAPLSWRTRVLASSGVTILTGPTPSGEAQIQLTAPKSSYVPTTKPQDLDV